jgi:hypothetical protein
MKLRLAVFCLYFIIPLNTRKMSHLKVTTYFYIDFMRFCRLQVALLFVIILTNLTTSSAFGTFNLR